MLKSSSTTQPIQMVLAVVVAAAVVIGLYFWSREAAGKVDD